MGIINIIVFDDDDLTKAMVDSYLKEVTFPFEVLKYNQFEESLIPSNDNVKIIFININKSNTSILKKIEKITLNKNNNVIVISNDKSTDLNVKSLRTGAKDCLIKPLVKTDFINIIQKVYKNEVTDKAGNIMSNIYTVVSPESGTGKTFFVVNLSKEVADITKEKVLIVDFNNNVNDISIMLDINSKYNTSLILNTINSSNAKDLINNIQQYKDSSLYIMANGLFTTSLNVDVEKFEVFLNEAKKTFKYIFFDVDPDLLDLNKYILNQSKFIYCLLDLKTNLAEKTKNYFVLHNIFGKVRFVVNKFRQRNIERLKEVESVLTKQVFCKIPQSAMIASLSMQNGKTIKELNPEIDIVKVYEALAKDIVRKD